MFTHSSLERLTFFFCLFFFETGFLCVALAVLELRNLPASASQTHITPFLLFMFLIDSCCVRLTFFPSHVVLGTKLMVLHMLTKCCTNEP